MTIIVKVGLNPERTEMRITSRGGGVNLIMPTFPKLVEEVALYEIDGIGYNNGLAFFWADITMNALGGLNVEFDFGRTCAWQPW